jgi:uncharacterized delta-60 repeat protein
MHWKTNQATHESRLRGFLPDANSRTQPVDRTRKLLLVIIVAATVGLSGVLQAQAADGDLDPTFGNGGKVITDFNNTEDQLYRIAIQPDGKIVAIGSTRTSSESSKYALARYNPDGTLDATFGTGGKVKTVIANVLESATGLFILPNGKIMIAGSIAQPATTDTSFALLRYNSNGSLDTTFGNGGIVKTNIGTYIDGIGRIALQSDGKIVAVGFTATFTGSSNQRKSDIVLARYNPDGSLDPTFGNGGIVISTIDPDLADDALALLIQPDGKVVLAGADREDFLVARYNTNGTLDTTFGTNGFTRTDIDNQSVDLAAGAILQPDGKIILAGSAQQACCTLQTAFAMARYTSNGFLDLTFGTLGKVVFGSGELTSVVLQQSGKIIVLGNSGANFSLSRFNANGSLDSTFGNAGSVSTNFGGDNIVSENLTLQADGKLVASGFSEKPFFQNSDFALARYLVGTSSAPTAGPATISGRITTPDGAPLAGAVIRLNGPTSRTTITDGAGNYRFENVGTDNFYTVTPSLANYSFAPSSRSFSLVGNMTEAGFTASADASQSANAIDTTEYFVRQQYRDFLGREPDQGGLRYWSSQFEVCNGDATCIHNRRIDVSAAFFASREFQQTGSYVYGLYAGMLGRTLNYGEFNADRAHVLGGAELEQAKTAFAQEFVQRSEFINVYPADMTREQFVDAVIQRMQVRAGVSMTDSRDGFLSDYDTGGRALVARHASEASAFVDAEYNKAFVLMEYFGYLRRGGDQRGYAFWLDVLNRGAGHRGMVCSFITSTEYQQRFSTVVTHTNTECPQ